MKKSHLILLLCLLFCGQMFAQTFGPPTPANPDAPCEYEIRIEGIAWDADLNTLTSIAASQDANLLNTSNLPESFNIVQVSLNHSFDFKEYELGISIEQSGSSKPVIILFIL